MLDFVDVEADGRCHKLQFQLYSRWKHVWFWFPGPVCWSLWSCWVCQSTCTESSWCTGNLCAPEAHGSFISNTCSARRKEVDYPCQAHLLAGHSLFARVSSSEESSIKRSLCVCFVWGFIWLEHNELLWTELSNVRVKNTNTELEMSIKSAKSGICHKLEDGECRWWSAWRCKI